MQFFLIPPKASHLYLGFVDGDNSGLIGFYEDNLGELSVNYEIRNSIGYQHEFEPQPPVVNQGLVLHYTFDDANYIIPYLTPEFCSEQNLIYGNLMDSSDFGFYGVLYNDAGNSKNAEFSYSDAKYNMAVKILDEHTGIHIIHPIPDSRTGLPIRSDWSIATWFKYDAEHPYFSIYPPRCHAFRCTDNRHVTINPSNNYELSTTTNAGINFDEPLVPKDEYVGSGFYMSDLDAGWHHLAAIGAQGKTSFYIDGELVGQTTTQLTSNIEYIKAWMLDDFRVYHRVLSPSEIGVLAEKSTEPPVVTFSLNQCIADYSSDGNLHIPCLSLPENYDATQLYDITIFS